MTASANAPPSSIPGPVDLVSFLAEQQRNRRATWKLAALCFLTIAAMGIILGFIVTPLLLLTGRLLFGVIDFFIDFPAPMESLGIELDRLLQRVLAPFDEGTPQPFRLAALTIWIGPGVLALVGGWLVVKSLFSRAGVGGVLSAIHARPLRPDDLEEMQLANIVSEMAIAGGIAPPAVLLVDSPIGNAASIGASSERSAVVVSRRILDEMDRDETQGVLAHLVGSIGNGDLGIALMIMSVFQTFGLLLTLLDLPFSADARRVFARVIRFAIGRGPENEDEEATLVSALLTSRQRPETLADVSLFMQRVLGDKEGSPRMIVGSLILILFMPLILARLFAGLLLGMVTLFLLGPLIAAAWRNRRRLADSTAVQLTRNPSGLARALVHLFEIGGVMPGAGWGDMVFIVGTDAGGGRRMRALGERMQKVREQGGSFQQRLSGSAAAVAELREEHDHAAMTEDKLSFASQQGFVATFHPSINSRIVRLRAMGAEVVWQQQREFPWLLGCLLVAAIVVVVLTVMTLLKG